MDCKDCMLYEVCKEECVNNNIYFDTDNFHKGCERYINKKGIIYCPQCKYLHCHSAVDRLFFCTNPYGMKGSINVVEERHFCSHGERKQ